MNVGERKKPIVATILYKPNQSTYKRIEAAITGGYRFYIFDNSPGPQSESFINKYKDKIKYFTLNENVGIGPALKIMCSTAYYEGNLYFLYFDQDTIYNLGTLDFVSNCINVISDRMNFENKENLFSVTFRDATRKRRGKAVNRMVVGKYELYTANLTINSGTLFFLKNLRAVGWHDESYKIDGVDYYICLAAMAAGFKVAEIYGTPGLDHNSEQESREYKFLCVKYYGRKYHPDRIKDYLNSSLKLIVKSAWIDPWLTLRIGKLLISYLLIQVFIYLSIERKQEKG
jgi:rhamnosyltransferase